MKVTKSMLAAIGVDSDGFREVLGICEGPRRISRVWSSFLKHLKERGLKGARLFIPDACMGLTESLGDFYPEAKWQRCTIHFYRNIFSVVPSRKVKQVSFMLKTIHAQEDKSAAKEQAKQVIAKLEP